MHVACAHSVLISMFSLSHLIFWLIHIKDTSMRSIKEYFHYLGVPHNPIYCTFKLIWLISKVYLFPTPTKKEKEKIWLQHCWSNVWHVFVKFLRLCYLSYSCSIWDHLTFPRMLCVITIFGPSYVCSVVFMWWILCWWSQRQLSFMVPALSSLLFRMQCH